MIYLNGGVLVFKIGAELLSNAKNVTVITAHESV